MRVRSLPLLAVAALFLSLPVAAAAEPAKEHVYEGTVGAAPVVLALYDGPGDPSGHYFYRSKRFEIDLSGTEKDGTLALESQLTGDHLTLTRADAGLTGMLTTKGSRRLPVSLRPAGTPAALPDDLPPDLGLYERWRLAGLRFTPQQAETIDGRTVRWYREGLTGMRLFRLERGYAAPAMAAINRSLARHQWTEVSNWLQCPGMDGKSGVEESEAERPWLGTNHMSYLWRSSWSCAGAAHPDFGQQGYSYDTRTGRELALDDLLRFGATVPAADSDGWYSYRSDTFGPRVVALLRRYHPAEMKPPRAGDEDGCDYTDTDVWNFPAWTLSPKGLWLGAYFARAARACDAPDWAIIPWSALSVRE